MADRLEWFEFTIQPGSTPTTPVINDMSFYQGSVVEIDVKVPPGPAGNLGFAITAGGSQYIPRTMNAYVVPDDDYLVWPLANAINSGDWALLAYNTDIWPHLIQVGFQVNELTVSPGFPFSAPVVL